MDYNAITLNYDIVLNPKSLTTFKNNDELIEAFQRVVDFSDENRIIYCSKRSFLNQMWLNDGVFHNVTTIFPRGTKENLIINKVFSIIQKSPKISDEIAEVWKILEESNFSSFKDVLENKITIPNIVVFSFDGEYRKITCTKNISSKEDLEHFRNEYIKTFFERAKITGDKLKRDFTNFVKDFHQKDSHEHSKYPHIHLKKNNRLKLKGSAFFIVDEFFEENNLWKHDNGDEVPSRINLELDKNGFKQID